MFATCMYYNADSNKLLETTKNVNYLKTKRKAYERFISMRFNSSHELEIG